MKLRSGKTLNGKKAQQEQEKKQPIVAVLPNPPTQQQIQNVIVASRPFQQPYFYKVETKKECGHECCLWAKDKCCECMDKRPIKEDKNGYKAYNKTSFTNYSMVSRAYYYCSTCKNRHTNMKVSEITELKSKFYVEETKFILACNKKNLEIQELKKKLAELEKKLAELKKKVGQEKRDTSERILERNILESGLDAFRYHLGYYSDVMTNSWFPIYREKGLLYLKSKLLNESEKHHKTKPCITCQRMINCISDYYY